MSADLAPRRREPGRACELPGLDAPPPRAIFVDFQRSVPGASPVSFQGVRSVGSMAGMPGSPGTSRPAVLCPSGSRWRVARRTRGSYWVFLPEPTGAGPQIPGSLPAGVEPAPSDACRSPLGWIVREDRSLWTEGYVRRENPQRQRLGKLRLPLNKLQRGEKSLGQGSAV